MADSGNPFELRQLPNPARYFPPAGSRYEIAAGISRLGRDWGNGASDGRIFQIDRSFPHYRLVKLQSRREQLSQYYCQDNFNPVIASAIVEFIVRQLVQEYPELFELHDRADGMSLRCRLTYELIHLDRSWNLRGQESRVDTSWVDALDALACQLQEDLAVVTIDSDGRDRLAAIHLCFPNHWAAQEKIGRDFVRIHDPVAGIEPITSRAGNLVRMMVQASDPLIRFAWGIATDDELNHHPAHLAGRAFDPNHPRVFLRIERQTIRGFPSHDAALFTIRTYFQDCATLSREERANVCRAVESMTPQSLIYKGLARWKDRLIEWLKRPD